jgi:hypothetical protein
MIYKKIWRVLMNINKGKLVEIRKGVYAFELGRIQPKRINSNGKIEVYRPVKK